MNRYSANDFTPNAGQIARGMGHSIFAQVEIDHTVTNQEMAEKVAACSAVVLRSTGGSAEELG